MKIKAKSLLIICILLIFTTVFCSCESSESTKSTSKASTEATTETVAETTIEATTQAPTQLLTEAAYTYTNTLLPGNFSSNGQFINYTDGSFTAMQGIDVSEYNDQIDFNAVKALGIDFVIVRLGGRGYGNAGALYGDDMAYNNVISAKSAGLKVGGYFFSQAISEQEAIAEAQFAIDALNGEGLDFPIAFDWEEIDYDTARTDNLDSQTLTQCAKAFCDTVSSNGYLPMIYAKSKVYNRYDKSILTNCDFWISDYAEKPFTYNGFTMWQYSQSATINGINGNTDLNLCFKNY